MTPEAVPAFACKQASRLGLATRLEWTILDSAGRGSVDARFLRGEAGVCQAPDETLAARPRRARAP